MNIDSALSELAELLKVDALKLNESGLCRVVFDQGLQVDFEADPDGKSFHLCSLLCRIPTDGASADFYSTLLHANFLGEGTGGAYFAVDVKCREVLFLRTLDLNEIEFSKFAKEVESFVNYLDGWTRKIRSGELVIDSTDIGAERADSAGAATHV